MTKIKSKKLSKNPNNNNDNDNEIYNYICIGIIIIILIYFICKEQLHKREGLTFNHVKENFFEDIDSFESIEVNENELNFELSKNWEKTLERDYIEVYLNVNNTNKIYGPIYIYNKTYKLIDINSKASSNNIITISIENIATELLKKDINIILSATDNVSPLTIQGTIDSNKYILPTKYQDDINELKAKLKSNIDEKKETYKEDINTDKTNNFIRKLNKLIGIYNSELENYGIDTIEINTIDSETIKNINKSDSSFYRDLINDDEYKNIFNWYNKSIDNMDIKQLQTEYNNLQTYERLCSMFFNKYNEKLDIIIDRFKKRKNAITNNQYKPIDKNARIVLGNNTNHFQDGSLNIGVFEFNKD